VRLTKQSPIRDVLTPAACYHFYIRFQKESLDAARYVTTRATCYRREAYYSPLERQWGFSMREIVCLGTAEEVKEFLARYQERVDHFFKSTDPFFNPSRNPKYLLQKLDPVKTEMIFGDGLAIGSINFHRNYFGEAFEISREGREAFSGCVAFGIERWIYAFLSRYGLSEGDWPDLDSE
jgi:seryl-tRNA synthetase